MELDLSNKGDIKPQINGKTESHTFIFIASLDEKPQTRSGVWLVVSRTYEPLGLDALFLLKVNRMQQKLSK